MPEAAELRPSQETLPNESFESFEQAAGDAELALVAKGLSTENELMKLATKQNDGETLAALMQEIREAREESRRFREDLARLRSDTALGLALALPEGDAVLPSPISAQALAEHPERARTLLESVQIAAREREDLIPEAAPQLRTLREETSEALMRVQESGDSRYGTLSMKVAEIAARALANAAGRGHGVAGYDIIKEVTKAYRAKA
jgi:aryl-alcohol dehydrogenase-like predicted oxidoreductase